MLNNTILAIISSEKTSQNSTRKSAKLLFYVSSKFLTLFSYKTISALLRTFVSKFIIHEHSNLIALLQLEALKKNTFFDKYYDFLFV